MQTIDRMKEKFEAQGHPGVAEERVVKNVNRWRATGVLASRILGVVGIAVAAGGLRHGGLDGAVREVGQALTSPLRNDSGDLDFPGIDIQGSKPSLIMELPRYDGNAVEIGSAACPTVVETVNLELNGRYVSTATYNLNSKYTTLVSTNALDKLWENHFSDDNNGADPNNPDSNIVNLRRLESIENCEIR